MNTALSYSMTIEWSDEDEAYLVRLPEFGPSAMTHGNTYKEAAKHGQEVLEMLVESYMEDGQPLPAPQKYSESKARKSHSNRRRTSSGAATFKLNKMSAKQG